MKVRFYCDIPSHGMRLTGLNSTVLYAVTAPNSHPGLGFTRVAFDVDMPPNLVLPAQDLIAPAEKANVIETGHYDAEENKHD